MSNHAPFPIVAPKKLIEVAIPLDEINKASAREKSIRHGHPSTLHLWWARRPLAAARAVLFAQLVNDPSWKYSEEELKKPQVKGAITKKRNELFQLIGQLVQWENTNNEDLLKKARAAIWESWRETCEANKHHPDAKTLFDPAKLPGFHDPFAGGGAIPLEAQRLGLVSHASDLNPVAVLINKAMIEIPPKFAGKSPINPSFVSEQRLLKKTFRGAEGLAEDVRYYGQWMRDEAEKRIGHLYPQIEVTKELAKDRPDLQPLIGQKLTVIAWLWARTVASPNPAVGGAEVPLVSTYMLSTTQGKEAYVHPVVEQGGYRFTVRVGKPPDAGSAKSGTKLARGANFQCLLSETPISDSYIKAEGKAGRIGARLMAIVAEGVRGRLYLPPTVEQQAIALRTSPSWRPDLLLPDNARWFSPPLFGFSAYGDLFTSRQLVALTTFSDLVQEARQRALSDATSTGFPSDGKSLADGGIGAHAYADAVAMYLGIAVSKLADAQSSLCRWKTSMDQSIATFGRQALPMVWDFSEANALGGMAGDLLVTIRNMMRVLDDLSSSLLGCATQADSQTQNITSGRVVSTDPPYYDNIGYADLSDFFYVWMRRSLKSVFPDLFATLAVPKAEELVATPYRHGSKEQAEAFFLNGMTQAMHRLAEQSHPAFPVSIYYAFKQSETESSEGTASTGWETFLDAVLRAGFGVSGTWPMRTELSNRMIGMGTNALASSIVLVCHPRPTDATTVSRREFLSELKHTLPLALAELQQGNIAPVDLAQASIGPGMAVFTKHKAVLEADGSPMAVRAALIHINKAIDDYFSEAEGDMDADTRFCIGWFQQYEFAEGPFGEADVLARAKGTAVDGVRDAGVIHAGKGKVRLLRVKEYPTSWDPKKDSRLPIWEACHQMCRALGESESEAGALLARMPEKQDAIRQLAYRLYTICERKGWAEDARAYNELVTSWPAIVEQSLKAGHKGSQMSLL
ncbi:MAG: DUF1156 domain-containing protein [Myxococcales bacterium]|nr:DUF1156 domain-containing protein [Myxococcales bacterium]